MSKGLEEVLEEFTNHTGGAYGVDTYGCLMGLRYGFKHHIHYRPYDNTRVSAKLRERGIRAEVIDEEAMRTCRNNVNILLGADYKDNLVGNLQSRNYLQVAMSDKVYCFGLLNGSKAIKGGTNTAFQLAIILDKPLYFFNIISREWSRWDSEVGGLVVCEDLPILSRNYAIVGTRDVEGYHVKNKKTGLWGVRESYLGDIDSHEVKKALSELYKRTIKSLEELS